ncbi:hypothetical protein JHK82_026509 [Glycine max]|nr:hypothetical protein JHK85_027124 [Glycine max]KAG5125674.1 hypothetical protein JHK82_026509 [Glycine max]
MQFLKLPRLLMPYVRRIHLHSQPLPSQSTCKFDGIDDAVALFHRMADMHPLPSIVEFTKILGTIAKMRYYATAIDLYTLMEYKGVVPFTVTFNILINCFCHMGQMDFAFSVMGKILKWGCRPNVVTFTTLMKGFCVNDKMLDALYIYDEMVARRIRFDDVLYGTLINGLCKSKIGKPRAAVQLLQKMEERQLVKPNLIMYNTVVHGQRKEVTSLLNGFCLNNKVDEARELFNVMIERGYCKFERVGEAMNLLEDMFLKNLVPNIITYNSVVDGLCKSGGILDAWKLVDEMHYCCQPPPDVTTYNILLESLCRIECVEKAIAFFKHLIFERSFAPNVWSYNILISGCCKNRRLDEAINLFNHMCFKNLVPDIVTYNILLDALFNGQQLDKAIALLVQIVDQVLQTPESASASTRHLAQSLIHFLLLPLFCPLSSISTPDYFSEPEFEPKAHFIPMAIAREVAVGAALLFTAPSSVFMVVLKKKIFSLMCMPLCICKGKAAYNIPPLYLRIAKSLWAMGYEVFIKPSSIL